MRTKTKERGWYVNIFHIHSNVFLLFLSSLPHYQAEYLIFQNGLLTEIDGNVVGNTFQSLLKDNDSLNESFFSQENQSQNRSFCHRVVTQISCNWNLSKVTHSHRHGQMRKPRQRWNSERAVEHYHYRAFWWRHSWSLRCIRRCNLSWCSDILRSHIRCSSSFLRCSCIRQRL